MREAIMSPQYIDSFHTEGMTLLEIVRPGDSTA